MSKGLLGLGIILVMVGLAIAFQQVISLSALGGAATTGPIKTFFDNIPYAFIVLAIAIPFLGVVAFLLARAGRR